MTFRIPSIEFEETTSGYRLRFGSVRMSQSTFLLIAAMVTGLGGGYGAVIFRWLISVESRFALGWLGAVATSRLGPFGILVPLVTGGTIVAYIVNRFSAETKGHGVPEVMEAVAVRAGIIRARVIVAKCVASATSIGFGGSCGREGPIVQIGSAIGSTLGQLVTAPAQITRTLVACGAAAGISATFNAPIAGVFFASEVILGDFAPRSFVTIVVSSVTAAVIGRAYLGNRPSFDAAAFALASPLELWLYALLGVIAAVWAAGFVKALYHIEDAFDGIRLHPMLKTAFGFGLVGVIGVWFPQVFGVGYESVQQVLNEHVPATHALALAALKPIATSLTLGSGGSGGVFAPCLFTGAMLGDAFGTVVHSVFPSWTGPAAAYGLVAMAALFAGASEAPITAIMIVFEMSNDYTIILPLMIAVGISTVLGRRFIKGTIYELKLDRKGVNLARARAHRPLRRIKVRAIMRQSPVVARADESISAVSDRLRGIEELVLPVVGPHGYEGIVTSTDIINAMSDGVTSRPIAGLVRRTGHALSPDDTVEHAADLLSGPEVPLLPVIEEGTNVLIGVLTRRDVLNAYRSA
jgi:chloride channel protein, CIC family